MSLISVIIIIVVIGVALWAINQYVPMDPKIKKILNIFVVVALVIFLVTLFIGYLPDINVGKK